MIKWTIKTSSIILISLMVLFNVKAAWAQAITVFDVRKTLPLTPTDDTYQDFYINGGNEVGLKSGLIVTVVRRRALYDAYQSRSPGDLVVPVGRLKIIHSQKGLSVARLHSLFDRAELPMVDYDYIMVGDRLDMATARMPEKRSPAQKSKKQTQRRPSEVKAEVSVLGPLYGPESPKVKAESVAIPVLQ